MLDEDADRIYEALSDAGRAVQAAKVALAGAVVRDHLRERNTIGIFTAWKVQQGPCPVCGERGTSEAGPTHLLNGRGMTACCMRNVRSPKADDPA